MLKLSALILLSAVLMMFGYGSYLKSQQQREQEIRQLLLDANSSLAQIEVSDHSSQH